MAYLVVNIHIVLWVMTPRSLVKSDNVLNKIGASVFRVQKVGELPGSRERLVTTYQITRRNNPQYDRI